MAKRFASLLVETVQIASGASELRLLVLAHFVDAYIVDKHFGIVALNQNLLR